jgi:hypothetical protein
MKKINTLMLIIASIAIYSQSFGQNFYDRSTVQTIEIFFGAANWDAQLDALASTTEDYLLADSVRINGVVYDSVGVKYKGNSSYNPNNNKNPLHIELDYVHGSYDYQGYTDIKLQNGYQDPSMIREVLSYAILEQYMDCPKANFANVYINGTLRGMYSNAESITDQFNGNHYFSEDGAFFKCNPVGGAGPGSSASPDLKWINSDSTSYYSSYEMNSSSGWAQLVNLINTLNNNFTQIETVLDVDRALWMLAFNNVLVNLDSYSGAFRQNYYLYQDLNDRFVPTSWDLNMSFAGFPGGTGSPGYVATTLDPLSNSTSANHPLILKLLSDPFYKRMYMAHLRTIAQEMFISGSYLTTANSIRTTIDASVQADPFKFYTYTQFQNSLTTAVTGGGPGGSSIPGIQTLMTARMNYYGTNANYTLVAPTIQAYVWSNPQPQYSQTVTLNVTCSNENAVYLGYRFDHALKFTRVPLFDDGLHNDGSAGDHIYGVDVQMSGGMMEYYVYAENSNAGLFSPQRAEHEFHTLMAAMSIATINQVVLNEVVADNETIAFDANNESGDWVELYNTTSSALSLNGLYLSDDPFNYTKWAFPSAASILPGEHLIVWADGDSTQYGLHANFKLNDAGETLILSDGVTIFDQMAYPTLNPDQAYARCPDAGVYAYAIPTFASSNNCYAGLDELSASLSIYPNPSNDIINIDRSSNEKAELMVVDATGRIMYSTQLESNHTTLSIDNWKNGIYILKITDQHSSVTRSIVKN